MYRITVRVWAAFEDIAEGEISASESQTFNHGGQIKDCSSRGMGQEPDVGTVSISLHLFHLGRLGPR